MLPPALETLLKPQVMLLRVIWAALMSAVIFYAVVSYQVVGGAFAEPSAEVGLLRYALGAAGFVSGLLSFVVPRFIPSDDTIRRVVGSEPDAAALAVNPQTGRPDTGRAALIAALSSPERRLLAAAPLGTVQFIVRIALAEIPAILGFVLVFLSRDPMSYLPFGAFSLVLMVLAYPRIESFLDRAAALRG